MRKAKFFAAALLAMSSLGAFAQHQFTVQANKPGAEIQPTMYGIFFEDINFGADGGLYAEMVENRSFEFPQRLMGWNTFGNVTLSDVKPAFDRNPHYVTLESAGAREKQTGLENRGFFGHTQTDGTMEITDLDKTEENRKLVEDFLCDVMQGNNLDKTPDYFDGDTYIQHNTGIADGVSGLNAALGAMAEQGISMVYDEVHMVLAQGNFVLAVSEGTFGGEPTSYYDLWRVENGKIAEHWDVMETIADQSTWQNENGKF